MVDPRTPTDDMRAFPEALREIRRRLSELEAPSGTQAFRTVEKLAATVAEVAGLVDDLETRLDAYLATDAPALIAAEVAAQLDARLAGNVAIGGTLSVAGPVTMSDVHAYDLTTAPGSYTSVYVRADGRVGRL